MRRALVAFVAVALALPFAAGASQFTGIVSHVTDGDTLWVRPQDGGPPQQVRIEGIDAPEICQAWGREAREALAQRLLHRRVKVTDDGQDDYRRTIAVLHRGREDVGRWLVVHGHAWSYRFHGQPGPYAKEEAKARARRLGLWAADAPERPRDFRVRHGGCR